MSTEPVRLNLHQKLIEVRKGVDYLQQANQGVGFKYVSSSQVIMALRTAMNEQGVLLVPQTKSATVSDHITQTKKTWKFTELHTTYTWINADNPEEKIECQWYSQGLDDMEKGVGKALTYGEKYFLLKFFNIPTDKDDPDARMLDSGNKANPDADPLGIPPKDSRLTLAKPKSKAEALNQIIEAKGDESKACRWASTRFQRDIKKLDSITKEELWTLWKELFKEAV